MPKPTSREALIAALDNYVIGGRLFDVGTRRFTVDAGEVELEIEIKVKRRAPLVDVARYRTELLEELAAGKRVGQNFHRDWHEKTYDGVVTKWGPVPRARCESYTKGGGTWPRRGGGQCEARPTAAIVHELMLGGHSFRLVCNRHREHNTVDASRILAVVELTPLFLEDAFRRGCEARQHERDAKLAAARAAGKPVCKRCGVDGTCCVPPCEFEGHPAIPPCAAAMGCLCAGHARGNPADAACDTREAAAPDELAAKRAERRAR